MDTGHLHYIRNRPDRYTKEAVDAFNGKVAKHQVDNQNLRIARATANWMKILAGN